MSSKSQDVLERMNSRAEELGCTEITKISNKDFLTQYRTISSKIAKKRQPITWIQIKNCWSTKRHNVSTNANMHSSFH